MKKTPMYDAHLASHAKMVSFHDYLMPLQYDGIISEHLQVRGNAGLFDISHMGCLEVFGGSAFPFIQRLITNDASRLGNNQIIYTPICNEQGGVIDDVFVYRRRENHFMLVVNCANTEKNLLWLRKQAAGYQPLEIRDLAGKVSLIALQGPQSGRMLETTLGGKLDFPKRFFFTDFEWEDARLTISRTGYTGEDGFEILVDADHAVKLWERFLEKNGKDGLRPVGLGARDTLRLEAGLLLYGNDMDETVTPLETTIDWTVKFDKGGFIGRDALLGQKARGIGRKLAGFEMVGRGIPRHGYPVLRGDEIIGKVTSGTFSPSTNKNIGLCLIKPQYTDIGEGIQIQIRDNRITARIVKTPFYKRGAVMANARF